MNGQNNHYKVSADDSNVADVLLKLFVNRMDTYAVQKENGEYVRIAEPLTKDVVKRHLTGEITVGVYQVNPNGDTVTWICLDIDPDKVPEAERVVESLYRWALETWPKEAVWVEASRYPDASFHIWVFFVEPVPADVARWLGKRWNEKAGHPKVEVFPKQDSVKNRFGNLVKLPLGVHREHGKRSRWLNPESLEPLPDQAIVKAFPAALSEKQVAEIRSLMEEERQKRLTHYSRQTETSFEGVDVNAVPCVKAFHDTPIPPSYRHMAPVKNFAILYWQVRGSWEGFEQWAEWLRENQPDFRVSDVVGWRDWVNQEPRRFNHSEVENFLRRYVPNFSCEGCVLKQALSAAEEPVHLAHLNMVEDPACAGQPVMVDGLIASTSVAYLVPKEVEAVVESEDNNPKVFNVKFDADDPFNLKLVGVNEDVKWRRLKRLFGDLGKVKIKEKAWRTIYRVKVRPPVFTLEKRGRRIVDEKGFEYKAFDVYVVADHPLTFEASSLVKLLVKPLGSPKTQQTVLLAWHVDFPEEKERFDEVKLRQLKAKLDAYNSVEEKVKWILGEFQKFSGLVGRRNLAYAGFLTFFSPLWVEFNGEIQRGWVVTLFIGDTTTGKSETLLKLIMLLKGGMMVTGETASQVGLTGTAVQVEKEGWFTEWGFLVLCDRKLLGVDGIQKLPLSASAGMAEAERTGVVTISKAAKNSAYARTRQIKIANPVDRESAKWETKTLENFLYPCQAIPTVLDKTSIARLDLAVFSSSGDVKAEEVNVPMDGKPEPELDLLSEALKWCWSGRAKVEFTEDAVKEILTSATELHNTFHTQSVPLVSMDMKWKLARLSAALASLTLSTDDFTTVKVTSEHVKEVVDFLRVEYSKAGLNILAQEERHEIYTSEDAEIIIPTIAEQAGLERDTLEAVLKFIVLQGRVTRDQLKTRFSIPEHPQLRSLLASLQNSKLIRVARGFYPTPQLIQLYKVLISSRLSSLSRSEKDPPKNSGGGEDGSHG